MSFIELLNNPVKVMEAIEFKTKVKDGTIKIPQKYKQILKDTVKVIILCDPKKPMKNIINELWENPIEIDGFSPLSREEIYERFFLRQK